MWERWGEQSKNSGHGGGDLMQLIEFVQAVREDREPIVDVYDSAAWSSLVELTRRSIDAGGAPVEIPDFTRGKWKE